jgi:hypothetical protein
MGTRDVKFTITMDNKASGGLKDFTRDLEAIKTSVQSVGDALRGTGTAKLKNSIKNVRDFVNQINRVGNRKGIGGFIKISNSFDKIGGALKSTSKDMGAFASSIRIMVDMTDELSKKVNNVGGVVNYFQQIAGALKLVSESMSNARAKNLGNFFDTINALSITSDLTPMSRAIQKMAEAGGPMAYLATSIQRIARSLTRDGVGSAARSLALVAQGGGGGTYRPGAVVGAGKLGGEFMKRQAIDANKYVDALTTEGLAKSKAENLPPTAIRIAESLFTNADNLNRSMGAELDKWREFGDKRVNAYASSIENRPVQKDGFRNMPIKLGPSTSMTKATSTDYSGMVGTRGGTLELAMMRGSHIHGAAEEMTRMIEEEHEGMANFLSNKMYEQANWAGFLKETGHNVSESFRDEITRAAGEKGVYIGGKPDQDAIATKAKEIKSEIFRIGYGKSGVFHTINKMVEREVGDTQGKEAKIIRDSVKLIAEHKFKPTEIIKPGGKFAEKVPANLKRIIAFQTSRLKKELVAAGRGDLAKKFRLMIRERGAMLSGMADLMVEVNGKMVGLFDWKSGGSAKADSLQNLVQTGIYAGQAEMEFGKGRPQPHIVRGGATEGATVTAVPGIEHVRKVVAENDKKELESAKKQVGVAKERNVEGEKTVAASAEVIANIEAQVNGTGQIRINEEHIAKSRRESAATVPPGGIVPPGDDGGSVFGSVAMGRGFEERSKLHGSSDYISQYTDNITKAYLNQEMLNQRVDLTKVKMGEFRRIIDGLSGAFSKQVSISSSSNKEFDRKAIIFEKITGLTNAYSSNVERVTQIEEKQAMMREKWKKGHDQFIEKWFPKKGSDLRSLDFETPDKFQSELTRLEQKANVTDDPTKERQKMAGAAGKKYQELSNDISIANAHQKEYTDTITNMSKIQRGSNSALETFILDLKAVDKEFQKEIKLVNRFEDGLLAITRAAKRADLQMLTAGSENALKKDIALLEKRAALGLGKKYRGKEFTPAEALQKSSKDFSQDPAEISAGIKVRQNLLRGLGSEQQRLNLASAALRNNMSLLDLGTKQGRKEWEQYDKTLDGVVARFNILDKKTAATGTQLNSMSEIQRRNASKTAEHFRASVRTTIKGFRDMMKSQMAWVAGYGIMFGTINLLKTSLMSVIDVQHQFARAMRTARSATTKTSGLLTEYMNVGVAAMITYGQKSEMVGEVLYHLGSAGLYAHESLGALNSTLRMIIATEADVGETTKMIAGIYNNFSEQIVSTEGAMGKFKYINDVIVATFRDHQVEIKELRDGLKHLSAMGKESNLTFTEQAGVLATLNDHLIKSGIAGRSVQTMLSKISKTPIAFAKAFDIEINPLMPLKLIDILEQVNKKMGAGATTVMEIGNIFDRLGLRGAKTFITLVKYVDELKNNIDDLKHKSEGANEEMSNIMLDKPDVAFAKMREALGALVRTGFGPVVESAFQLSKTIAKIGFVVQDLNKITYGFIGGLFKFVSVMGMVGVSLWAFKTIGKKAFGPDTFDGHYMRKYFDSIKLRSGDAKRAIFADLGAAFGKGPKPLPGGKRTKQIYDMWGVGNLGKIDKIKLRMKSLGSAVDRVGVSLMGSALAFKLLLAAAAAYVFVKVVDHLVTTNQEYVTLADNIANVIAQSMSEIQSVNEKIKAYDERNTKVKEYVELLKEQKEIEQRSAMGNLEEQIMTVYAGFKQTSGTIKDLERQSKLRDEMDIMDPNTSFVGVRVDEKLENAMDAYSAIRKNIVKIKVSLTEMEKSDPDTFNKLNAMMLTLNDTGIDLQKMLDISGKKIKEFDAIRFKSYKTTEAGKDKDSMAQLIIDLEMAKGSFDELYNKRFNAAKQGAYYVLTEKLIEQQEKLNVETEKQTDLTKGERTALAESTGLTYQQLLNYGAANILNIKNLKNMEEVKKIVEKILNLTNKRELMEQKINLEAIAQVRTIEKLELATSSFVTKTQGSMLGDSGLSKIFTLDNDTVTKLDNQLSKMKKNINTFKGKGLKFKQLWWDKTPEGNKGIAGEMMNTGEIEYLFESIQRRNYERREEIILIQKKYLIEKQSSDFILKLLSSLQTAMNKTFQLQEKLGKEDELNVKKEKIRWEYVISANKTKQKLMLNQISINKAIEASEVTGNSPEVKNQLDNKLKNLKDIRKELVEQKKTQEELKWIEQQRADWDYQIKLKKAELDQTNKLQSSMNSIFTLQKQLGNEDELSLQKSTIRFNKEKEIAKIKHEQYINQRELTRVESDFKLLDKTKANEETIKYFKDTIDYLKKINKDLEKQLGLQGKLKDIEVKRADILYNANMAMSRAQSLSNINEIIRSSSDELRNMSTAMLSNNQDFITAINLTDNYRSKIEGLKNARALNMAAIGKEKAALAQKGDGDKYDILNINLRIKAMKAENAEKTKRIALLEKEYEYNKKILIQDKEQLMAATQVAGAAIPAFDAQLELGDKSDLHLMQAKVQTSSMLREAQVKYKLSVEKTNLAELESARSSKLNRGLNIKILEDQIDTQKLVILNLGIEAEAVGKINELSRHRVNLGYQAKQIKEQADATFNMAEANRTAEDGFRNMEYGIGVAQSRMSELINIASDYESKIEAVRNEIKKNNKTIDSNNLLMEQNGKKAYEKNRGYLLENMTLEQKNALSARQIEWLEKEAVWKNYITDINRKVADSEFRAATAKEAYQGSVNSSGMYSDVVDENISSLNTYIRLTQKAKELDFYKIQVEKLKLLGASEEEISNAIIGFHRKMNNERTLMAKAYYDYVVQRQNELYQAEAEVEMRTSKNTKEGFDATLKSIGAGFSQYYTSIENTSKAISDSVNNMMSSLSSSLSTFTYGLAMGFPEVSGEVDSLRSRLGDLEQQYNDALGQDRLDQVAAIGAEMRKVRDEIDEMNDPLNRATEYFMTFAETVVKEVQKMVIELLILKPLMEMMKGWLNPGASSYGGSDYTGSSSLYSGGSGSQIMAEGGYLMGGIPGKDSIPILGMPGEYMIPKDSVDYYGIGLMERLRNREVDRMAEGGLVGGGMDYGSNNGSSSGTSVSVKLENKGNSNIEATEATMSQIDPGQYIVNVVLDDVDSYGPLYQAFKGGR